MAKQRKGSKPSGQAAAGLGHNAPAAADEPHNTETAGPRVKRTLTPRATGQAATLKPRAGVAHPPEQNGSPDTDDDDPNDDPDEGDSDIDEGEEGLDEDDEEGGDEDDEEEGDDETAESVPALTVPNDSPEVWGLLRGMLTDATAGHGLADYLMERDDPRGEYVRLLVTTPVLIPPCDPPWGYEVVVVATEQWVARLKASRLTAWSYRGTALARALGRWGGEDKLGYYEVEVRAPSEGWTREATVAAVDRARRRIVYGLFGTTEEEVRCPPEKLRDLRVRRLVRLSRQYHGVDRVCAAVEGDPDLRDAVLAALAQKEQDHGTWAALMDRLNPGWRRRFTPERAK